MFSFQYADRRNHGEWSWPVGEEAAEMLNFLYDMGQLTWVEVRSQTTGGRDAHRKHHAQGFETVTAKAQGLISQLRHDEVFEELFRFRVGSRKRLWGYVRDGVFYVLWWDANHQIYPTEPG